MCIQLPDIKLFMIERIRLSSADSKYTPSRDKGSNKKQPSFGGMEGLANLPLQAIQMCEKYPMVNVSVLDLTTAIVPRTYWETKDGNAHAGFEAFRRESSGLIVNCLLPSFIVLGLSKLLHRPVMSGFKKSNISGVWANGDSLDKFAKYYNNAKGSGRERVENYFRSAFSDLSGVDGKDLKSFKQFDLEPEIKKLGEAFTVDGKASKEHLKKAWEGIISKTHITENIKFKGDKGFASTSLGSFVNDSFKMLKNVEKEGLKSSEDVLKYISKAKKLVNVKSLAGLAVIIPLAISMQPINRWITRKTSGKKGAPIYKNFDKEEAKELTPKQKAELLRQKFISVGTMVGVGFLSMMRLPKMGMFQFNGLFPTMDQARLISTATFASRMAVSEDKNELRMNTVRDIATFLSFYFLGDYAAKAAATLIEKKNKGVVLLNKLKEVPKDASIPKKFWNWVKNTHLKSSEELVSKKAKNLRSVCQLSNIAVSLLLLGSLIPKLTISKANKDHERQYAGFGASNSPDTVFNNSLVKNKPLAFQSFFNS